MIYIYGRKGEGSECKVNDSGRTRVVGKVCGISNSFTERALIDNRMRIGESNVCAWESI